MLINIMTAIFMSGDASNRNRFRAVRSMSPSDVGTRRVCLGWNRTRVAGRSSASGTCHRAEFQNEVVHNSVLVLMRLCARDWLLNVRRRRIGSQPIEETTEVKSLDN